MTPIEKAIEFALQAHAGQTDKGGEPYICHPLRLMLRFNKPFEMMTAVLHDAVEDGGLLPEMLERGGIPVDVVDAVKTLTKRSGEEYGQYIARVANNSLARIVKIEDLKDNLDLLRLKSLNGSDLQRVEKYHKALIQLLGDH